MGIYTRKDSPWWWLWLERRGQSALRERTKILVHAATAAERARQRALAEDAYRVRMGELARGVYDLPGARPAITFEAYAAWYETHISVHQRGATREREMLRTLRAAFGARPLTEVTKAAVREWMTTRATRVSAATVNRELDLLKSLMREAVPAYLPASPLVGMRRLATVEHDMRVLSRDDETALLAAMADPRDRLLVVAGLDTLARLGSLLALTWEDDKGTHLVFRNPKNGVTYKVPVSTRLRAALDAQPAEARRTPHVFAHRRVTADPKGWRNRVKMLLRHACARANVPYGRKHGGITFHTLRHTGASRMLAAGVDLRTVQELGGWSDIRLLTRYLHPTGDAKRRAVESVSQAGVENGAGR